MPCYDERNRYPSPPSISDSDAMLRIQKLTIEKAKLEAMLCGLMTTINSKTMLIYLMTIYDETKAGISPLELLDWWEDHQKKDKIRKDDADK